MGWPTDGAPPTSADTESDDWGEIEMEYMLVITVFATAIFLLIFALLTRCICAKCCGRTFKITCEEFQEVSIDQVKVDEPDDVNAVGYYNPRARGRETPWSTTIYSLNRGFNGGFLYDTQPSSVSGSPPQFWELGDGNPQVRALDTSSLHGQYTYTYDGHIRAQGRDETPSPIPALTDGGLGLSFQADHHLQELVRAGMSQSETIMVGSKLVVFISREVSHLGDTLVLNEMGISLTIPPYAIEAGRTERISLILDWDLGDFPGMNDDQTIISPVVHCGPHGLKLKKPAVLSYRHCAYDVKDVSLVASETHLMQNKDWREVCSREDGVRPYTLLPAEVQVQVSHFTLYTCLAEGKHSSKNKGIKKWMQLAVFGGKMRARHHYEVRVYLLNNTPCALQFAVQNEAKNHFKMLCPRKEFLFHGDDQDMLATVQHVNEGWSHRLDDRQERVPFLNLWHGKCPHVSFIFKHENEDVRDIDIRLLLHQQGRENIESDKTNLKVLASMKYNSFSKRKVENMGNSNKAVINVFPPGKQSRGKRRRYDSVDSVSSRSESISSVSSDVSSSSSSAPSSSDNSSDNTSNSSSDNEQLNKNSDQSTQQPCTQNMKIIITGDESPTPTNLLSQAGPPRTISHELCMELVQLLDPLASLGNDWRMLASALDLDSLIPLLKDTPAYKPTETLLEEVEHQCKGLEWLASVLVQARRLDAAKAVMKYVNMNNTCAEHDS